MSEEAPSAAGAGVAQVLTESVERLVGGATSLDVLFSGGLDSSLVAFLAAQRVRVTLVTVGMAGAADLDVARSAAAQLGLDLREVLLTPDDVREAVRRWASALADSRGTLYRVAVAFALGLAHARGPLVATGQGADELFFGYAHFRGLSREEAVERRRVDLRSLLDHEWPRAQRIARELSSEICSPFLDEEVIRLATSLPSLEWSPEEPPKARLREVAIDLGLPSELAMRPKRAMQYGTGIDRFLRREGIPTG